MSHETKVAVVTGAAQGIGRRTAEVLAEAGYALALLDLRSCEATLQVVRAASADAAEFIGDISDEGVVIRAARAVTKRWGRVDVLVNNAGISFITPAETMEVEDFRRVLEVNLVAPFVLARQFGATVIPGHDAVISSVHFSASDPDHLIAAVRCVWTG